MSRKVRFFIIGAVLLLASVLLEFLFDRQRHTSFDSFGFYAAFGFIACLLLVLIAVGLGRVIKRRDDYYDS